jgi:hypothetical protein
MDSDYDEITINESGQVTGAKTISSGQQPENFVYQQIKREK